MNNLSHSRAEITLELRLYFLLEKYGIKKTETLSSFIQERVSNVLPYGVTIRDIVINSNVLIVQYLSKGGGMPKQSFVTILSNQITQVLTEFKG